VIVIVLVLMATSFLRTMNVPTLLRFTKNGKGKSELQAKSAVSVNIVLEVRDNEHSLTCLTDCGNDPTVNNDETERVDRECETESSYRDGNGPLHDDQWTLVQNSRRAWKKGNEVIKDKLV
jgi:hypothetical protein